MIPIQTIQFFLKKQLYAATDFSSPKILHLLRYQCFFIFSCFIFSLQLLFASHALRTLPMACSKILMSQYRDSTKCTETDYTEQMSFSTWHRNPSFFFFFVDEPRLDSLFKVYSSRGWQRWKGESRIICVPSCKLFRFNGWKRKPRSKSRIANSTREQMEYSTSPVGEIYPSSNEFPRTVMTERKISAVGPISSPLFIRRVLPLLPISRQKQQSIFSLCPLHPVLATAKLHTFL